VDATWIPATAGVGKVYRAEWPEAVADDRDRQDLCPFPEAASRHRQIDAADQLSRSSPRSPITAR